MDNDLWARFKRSGWAGDGPQAAQQADDRLAQGADGKMDYSKSLAQDNYRDKTVKVDQSDAMKRRMEQAGGN